MPSSVRQLPGGIRGRATAVSGRRGVVRSGFAGVVHARAAVLAILWWPNATIKGKSAPGPLLDIVILINFDVFDQLAVARPICPVPRSGCRHLASVHPPSLPLCGGLRSMFYP